MIAFGGSWTFRLLRGSPCRTWIELLCHLVWAAKGQRVNQQSFYKPTQQPSKGKRKQQQRAAKSSDEPLDDDASR